jgi:hypothetical protein
MRALLGILLLASSANASAVVINTLGGVDYKWLEITATVGMSRQTVELELRDENSHLYGYEYASRALVESLFLSYAPWDGLGGRHGDPNVVAGVAALIDDFGATQTLAEDGVTSSYTTVDGYTVETDGLSRLLGYYGLTSECGGPAATCVGEARIYTDTAGLPVMTMQSRFEGWDGTGIQSYTSTGIQAAGNVNGHFLVAVVPVPAAVWLFGSTRLDAS